MQIFLGKRLTLQVETDELVEDVKRKVEEKEGTPAALQRLLYAGRQLEDGRTLGNYGVGRDSMLQLVLRLRGGKGGFGSLLRGAGKHKLVDNYDACRDLQGRRIRHKTAEKKLEEWQAAARERELEKQALRALKEQAKAEARAERAEVDVQAVRQEHKESLQGVLAAVQDALRDGGAAANGTGTGTVRKAAAASGAPAVKRLKIDPLAVISEDEDELSDSDTDSEREQVDEAVAGAAAAAQQPAQRMQEQQPEEPPQHGEQEGKAAPASTEQGSPAIAAQQSADSSKQAAADSSGKSSDEHVSADGSPAAVTAAEEAELAAPQPQQERAAPAGAAAAVPAEPAASLDLGPVDLSEFSSAEELASVGLDRLKAELQRHGLKCGGNLQQRAARLFLLKHTPLDQLDRKHFAAAK